MAAQLTLRYLPGQGPSGVHAATAPVTELGNFVVGRAPAETRNVTAVGQPADRPTPSDITLEPGGCAVFEDFGSGVFSGGQRLVLIGGLEGSAMVLSRRFPGAPSGSFDRWTWTQLSEGRVRRRCTAALPGETRVVS
jgi:hypothetical protein